MEGGGREEGGRREGGGREEGGKREGGGREEGGRTEGRGMEEGGRAHCGIAGSVCVFAAATSITNRELSLRALRSNR